MGTLYVNNLYPQTGSQVSVIGNVSASTNISASGFYGDGSGITGVTGAEWDGTITTSMSGASTLQVVGAAQFGNTLSATGSISGSAGFAGHQLIIGNSIVISETKGLAVAAATATTISGSSTLQAGGTATLRNVNAQAVTATTYSGSSTMEVVGNTFIGGNLAVSGTITHGGASTFTSLSASSTLEAVGATVLGSTLAVSGNVGVATSPSAPLHVYKEATSASPTPLELIRLESQDEGVDMSAGHGPAITFYVGETGGTDWGGTVAVVREEESDADSAAAMVFHTAVDDTLPAERMRITSTGKVGIGDTSPSYTLDVTGDGQFTTDLRVGNDLLLTSDSAILSLGGGADFTITHDGTTGATLAGTPISINSTGDLTLDSDTDIVVDAAGGNVEFKDAGTLQLTLDMDGEATGQVIKLGVDGDDLIFQQYGGGEVLRIEDDGSLQIGSTAGLNIANSSHDMILKPMTDAKEIIFQQYDGDEVCRMADNRRLYFFDKGGEHISSDGTNLYISAGSEIKLGDALSGSSTFHTVGAATMGSTLDVTGAFTCKSTGQFQNNLQVQNAGTWYKGPNGGIDVAGYLKVSAQTALRGTIFTKYQPAPATTDDGTTAISAANILTGIVLCTPTADRSKATDSAANLQSALGFDENDDSFDFSVINLATDGTSHITITAGDSVTLVGCMVVSAQDLAEDAFTSGVGRFRIRRTSAGNSTMYRIS